jgi:hypothetical protein
MRRRGHGARVVRRQRSDAGSVARPGGGTEWWPRDDAARGRAGGGGAPTISPLFDDLSPAKWDAGDGGGWRDADDDTIIGIPRSAEGGGGHDVVDDVVSTVRITYFRGHGTAVGINISHLLGDASSCFRFCQVSFGCDKYRSTCAKGG